MNLLVYDWDCFNSDILSYHLKELGHSVYNYYCRCGNFNSDMTLASKLMEIIHSHNIQGVVSFNFLPIVSITCNAAGINYYSWIYDSPHLTLYSKSVFYPTNRIGCFDRKLTEEMSYAGINTVFHLPLACDSNDMLNRMHNDRSRFGHDGEKAVCDVSFVGSLYTDRRKQNYYDRLKEQSYNTDSISHDFWDSLDDIIYSQCFNYRQNLIHNNPNIDYSYLYSLMSPEEAYLGTDYFIDHKKITETAILEKKVTVSERNILMNAIAEHCMNGYDFRLYTSSDTSCDDLLNSVNNGTVDYDHEMPQVFSNSRINIHISLKSIRSGIPLRALDILSCGGFLLCDPQPEILENFEDGKEVAIYRSPEECLDKIDYYLSHDEERREIAKSGQVKAMELFNYPKMLALLL